MLLYCHFRQKGTASVPAKFVVAHMQCKTVTSSGEMVPHVAPVKESGKVFFYYLCPPIGMQLYSVQSGYFCILDIN